MSKISELRDEIARVRQEHVDRLREGGLLDTDDEIEGLEHDFRDDFEDERLWTSVRQAGRDPFDRRQYVR